MPYQTRSYKDIQNAILTDYANQIPGADTGEGSDIHVRASALASALWGLYNYQAWISRQIFPDTADSAELERHASIRGLARRQASKSSGTATLSGTNGVIVPSGLTLRTADGIYFLTTSGGTIAAGILDVTAQAASGGASGNIALSTALTVQDPPAGVNSAATAKTAFTGGSDAESDQDLLARLLDVIRKPPAGGSANDYKQWALEVAGVARAYVYPLRLGLGSVTVVPLVPGAGAARLPQQAVLDAVTAHIDAVRPVSVKTFQVLAPTAKAQDVTASIRAATGYTFNQVKPWVETAVTNHLNALAPLEVLYRSKVEKIISEVEGVEDRVVAVPAGNIIPVNSGATVEMIVPGAITITAMA